MTLSRPLLFEQDINFMRAAASLWHEALHVSNLYSHLHHYEILGRHGPNFDQKAALLNEIFKPDIKITVFHDYGVQFDYKLCCTLCNAVIRRVVKPGKLTCKTHSKTCNGELSYKPITPADW